MLDRLVDNWLAKANERSFQRPFAHILAQEGHTILHITRHCAMEAGKDILTIDPTGRPCAYQLKGAPTGKIKLSQWRSELQTQAVSLVTGKLVHPSVKSKQHHRSFLVTNGEFEEEVIREIDDFNRGFVDNGQPQFRLETIVGGEFKKKAMDLGKRLWPTELSDLKYLLEFLLDNGTGLLPKPRLAEILESNLPLDKHSRKKVSKAAVARSLASAALFSDIALSNYSLAENHVAEVEGWTLAIGHILAAVQRYNLPRRSWDAEYSIACVTIRNRLECLAEETRDRKHLVQGNPLVDSAVYRFRVTYIAGLLSALWIWRRWEGEQPDDLDDFIATFVTEHLHELHLWSEAAIPQILAIFWMYRRNNPTPAPDLFLKEILACVCQLNSPSSENPLPSPYYSAEEVFGSLLGFPGQGLTDDFAGHSWSLESLLHLFVRQNWKQPTKLLWPKITKIGFEEFDPNHAWQFFKWRNESGTTTTTYPPWTKNWMDLKADAAECAGIEIPRVLKMNPPLVLLYLIVMPHRIRPGIIRWLASQFSSL